MNGLAEQVWHAVTIFPSMAVVIAMPEGVLGPKRLKLPISKSFTSPWKWRIRMVHDWIERWRVTRTFLNFWSLPIWSHAEFFSRPREERCAVGRLRLYRNKVGRISDPLGPSWYLMISRNPEGLAQIWNWKRYSRSHGELWLIFRDITSFISQQTLTNSRDTLHRATLNVHGAWSATVSTTPEVAEDIHYSRKNLNRSTVASLCAIEAKILIGSEF